MGVTGREIRDGREREQGYVERGGEREKAAVWKKETRKGGEGENGYGGFFF